MEAPFNPDLPQDREKLRRLFRIKRVEGEMMKDRGYSLEEVYMMKTDQTSTRTFQAVNLTGLQNPNLPLTSLLQFRSQNNLFQSRQEFSSIYIDRERQRQILVIYLGNDPGKAVGKKDFKIVLQFIQTGQYHNIILVTETGLNADSANTIRRTDGYDIEVFKDIEFAFNPLKHSLSPISVKHIPGDQVSAWAQKEGLQPEKLPMILDIDPIAKWFGARPYDVFQYELLGTETDTIGFYRITRQAPVVKKPTMKK